ncbi:hypothetical protein [Gordonia sihwensis]|uniref:hypothetical protein n=1 Tax=Gordonia sihwensis TaxID=173559 RepID=UPI003D97E0F5
MSGSIIHVLAVVVGAARDDRDVYRHFGSILGFDTHARDAVRAGLVECDGELWGLTEAGQAFVAEFPEVLALQGRANSWDERPLGLALKSLGDLVQAPAK